MNYQNLMLLASLDTKRTLMHLFMLTNSAQYTLMHLFFFTNFAQYVRRVYATVIKFPCITTLGKALFTFFPENEVHTILSSFLINFLVYFFIQKTFL